MTKSGLTSGIFLKKVRVIWSSVAAVSSHLVLVGAGEAPSDGF